MRRRVSSEIQSSSEDGRTQIGEQRGGGARLTTPTAAETPSVEKPKSIKLSTFLEAVPPNQLRDVADLVRVNHQPGGTSYQIYVSTPEIHLHCTNAQCNGYRFFRSKDMLLLNRERPAHNLFIQYTCSNCRTNTKTFAVRVVHDGLRHSAGQILKFGELPIFGPPTPTRLLTLLEEQRDNFLAGRRCENQGLGIGAFGYYRRVVEHQKNRILEEIIKVAQKLGAGQEALAALADAKAETQFSKSVSLVKNAIPQSLLIKGHHNPLTLLHSALSSGLHEQPDDVCLDLAQSIRVVLAELAERLSAALKNDAELDAAVSQLLQIKAADDSGTANSS